MATAGVEILSSGYLPQVGVASPSKRSLVIYPCSDSESSSTNESNSISSGGRSKKLKPNLQNYTKRNDMDDSAERSSQTVAPSSDKISRSNSMSVSSEVRRNENFIQHSQKDFWDSLRNNYAYLMDDYLITTCKQTNEELLRINPDFSSSSRSSPSWTCTQFIQRFNELHDALHSLQAMAAEQNDKNAFLQHAADKLQEITRDCQLLKDQALLLEVRYPEMKDDIWRRCNILNNKWETLELTLWPKRKQEREGLLQKVTGKMKDIRRWLREVDHKLANLDAKENWSKEHITEVVKSQQVVQQEIETRGREVTSLVKDCQSLEGAAAAETLKRVRRVASNLERSWHTTWLRSLEIQCLTQQVLQDKQLHYTRDQTESDVDEGPLTKHRRLTSDFSPRIANMDNNSSKDSSSPDGAKTVNSRRSTREIGILCSVTKDLVSVNDKCIMVGTTGIAALKAKYGDDFTNFEIIQDVGYSSESSTHLSSDDVSDHIRIYSYSPAKKPYTSDVNSNSSLSKGTDYSAVSGLKIFGHSSLGSNSSHNDSGFGALEAVADAGEISPEGLDEQYLSSSPGASGDYYVESDLLDSVDFPNISEFENEHTDYGLDEMESSDSLDNFQNRSSFTSSARAFYKMTSVDSDYGDKGSQEKESLKAYPSSSSEDELGTGRTEAHVSNNLFDNGTDPKTSPLQNSSVLSSENSFRFTSNSIGASSSDNEFRNNDDQNIDSQQNIPNTDISSLSDIECLPVTHSKTSSDPQDSDISEEFLLHRRYANHLCSTPCVHHSNHHQKQPPKNHRKGRRRRLSFDESHDSTNNWDSLLCSCSKNKTTRSNRVREWLKRCSDGKSTSSAHHNTPAALVPDESASDDHRHPSPPVAIETAVDSSCDASGEYTTTESDDESADYHTRSGSVMGSVETVVPLSITCFRRIHLTGSHDGGLPDLLPPPPPPTPPTSCEETPAGSYSYRMSKNGSLRKPVRSISEGDLCLSGLKTSGMKQFNESLSALSGTKSSVNPEFIVPCMSTIRQKSESRRNTRMWRRSLPIFLCSESGHSSSDGPSQGLKSFGTLASLGYSSDISHWQKSLSGSGRRSRKRSSSKCSSTRSSSFTNRHHHHHGSRTTISASRGRHLSQSSGPHVNETLFAFGENQATQATDEDVPQSISSHADEDRPCIPQSPENDVILTQYEEQSTASDQVWDGYQEMPYLSEAYSEPTVDEDAVRKLTEFGDDYCSAIGSQPHGLGSSNRKRAETSAFPTKPLTYFAKTPTCPPTLKSSNNPVDSDSDIEDLHDILTETCRALQFARNTLNCRREGRILSQAENAELLATCQTHLRCLEVICEHIEIDGKEKNFSREYLVRLHDLIEEWAELQRTVVMNQQEVQNCEEKVLKVQKNIDDLYTKMSELSSFNHLNPKDIASLNDLQQKMEAIQMALSTLQETKEQLLAVNIQVHRIVTESGDTSSPLKQDITELYQQWEDAYEENGNQLTDLQLLFNRWQLYEKNYQELISRLREEQKRLQSSGDGDTHLTTGEDEEDTSFDDKLKELQIDAGFLECRLRGSIVWSEISNDLRQLHSEIQQLKHKQKHHSGSGVEELRKSTIKSLNAHHSDAASDEEEMDELDVDQKVPEDAKLKSEEDMSELPLEASDQEKPSTSSHSRLWRVLRAALPIQLALVFLYCLACALEPHCCDLLNNFNFSLSPQLRYVRGPPPV